MLFTFYQLRYTAFFIPFTKTGVGLDTFVRLPLYDNINWPERRDMFFCYLLLCLLLLLLLLLLVEVLVCTSREHFAVVDLLSRFRNGSTLLI